MGALSSKAGERNDSASGSGSCSSPSCSDLEDAQQARAKSRSQNNRGAVKKIHKDKDKDKEKEAKGKEKKKGKGRGKGKFNTELVQVIVEGDDRDSQSLSESGSAQLSDSEEESGSGSGSESQSQSRSQSDYESDSSSVSSSSSSTKGTNEKHKCTITDVNLKAKNKDKDKSKNKNKSNNLDCEEHNNDTSDQQSDYEEDEDQHHDDDNNLRPFNRASHMSKSDDDHDHITDTESTTDNETDTPVRPDTKQKDINVKEKEKDKGKDKSKKKNHSNISSKIDSTSKKLSTTAIIENQAKISAFKKDRVDKKLAVNSNQSEDTNSTLPDRVDISQNDTNFDDNEMNLDQHVEQLNVEELCGFRIVRLFPKSPASNIGLNAFEDFIIAINDILLESQDMLAIILSENENKPVSLLVWSCIDETKRYVTMTPGKWRGPGLMGAALRYEKLTEAADCVFHVLDVHPGSPSHDAGLIPDTDYIVGTPKMFFRKEQELYKLVKEAADQKTSFRASVYSSVLGKLRDVSLYPNNAWGGKGLLGCETATGVLHRIPPHTTAKNSAQISSLSSSSFRGLASTPIPPGQQEQTHGSSGSKAKTHTHREPLSSESKNSSSASASTSASGGTATVAASRKTSMKATKSAKTSITTTTTETKSTLLKNSKSAALSSSPQDKAKKTQRTSTHRSKS